MRKVILVILTLTIITSMVNIVFATDVSEIKDIASYSFEYDGTIADITTAQIPERESCIPNTDILQEYISNESDDAVVPASSDFVFNNTLLTKFNTITAPESQNGVNNPKFSYNTFL